ncbi:MAG TPA: PUR family DNA/RNA-binding protein [Candidatus Acidoferrales bacterium]|nr:PUR family DNA/RNA-binding protein [Candidatus Acidoferrales bacterium]
MISNERPSPYGRRPYQGGNQGGYQGGYQGGQGYGASKYHQQPRPPVQEDTLKSTDLQVERKNFVFSLKENPRGRFLRITEDVGGRRDTIIIPSTGLAEFKKVIDEMVKASESIPEKQPPPPDPMA